MRQALDQADVIKTALVALGSNQPLTRTQGPRWTVQSAMDRIAERFGGIRGKSKLYETPCFPPGAGPDYVNAAIALETTQPASTVLKQLHDIEAEFGRRRAERWGQRTLDLDLIALGQEIVPDLADFMTWRHLPLEAQIGCTPDHLILPHPRLQDRAFVLVPLADVAPDWRHPVLGRTVAQMLDDLPPGALDDIRPLDGGA